MNPDEGAESVPFSGGNLRKENKRTGAKEDLHLRSEILEKGQARPIIFKLWVMKHCDMNYWVKTNI